MGELPAFIKGVPEETIPLQKQTRIPTRIQVKIRAVKTTNALTTIFTVPEGYFLEMVYWSFSCINTVAPAQNNFDFESSTGGERFIFKEVILDHQEHFAESISLSTPMIFETGDVFSLNIGAVNAGTDLRVTFYANLIPIGDRGLI